MSDITVDELLAEWSKCETPNGNGMTTEELCDVTNMSPNRVRKLLKAGMRAGKIENRQERRPNPFRSGRTFSANVFVVKK